MNILNTFAQTMTTYTYDNTGDVGIAAAFASFFIFFIFFGIALYVISSIITAKLLKKAGQPGWAGWVPVYNVWKLLEISGYPGWLVLIVLLVGIVPVINILAPFVSIAFSIVLAIGIGRAFGKRDAGWIVLLVLLPLIGHAILAFGDAKYKKPTEKDLLFKI